MVSVSCVLCITTSDSVCSVKRLSFESPNTNLFILTNSEKRARRRSQICRTNNDRFGFDASSAF